LDKKNVLTFTASSLYYILFKSILLVNPNKTHKFHFIITDSNMTSFFRFAKERASYPFGIISLAHAPVNVTDFYIGSINCIPNNADRGRSIIRVT